MKKLIERLGGKTNVMAVVLMTVLVLGTMIKVPLNIGATKLELLFADIVQLILFVFSVIFLLKNKKLKSVGIINLFAMASVILLFSIELATNTKNIFSTLLLLKYIFTGVILFTIFKTVTYKLNAFFILLCLFSLLWSISCIVIIFLFKFDYKQYMYDLISVYGNSSNYAAAILLCLSPIITYMLIKQNIKGKHITLLGYGSLLLGYSAILLSGSRVALVVAGIQLIAIIAMVLLFNKKLFRWLAVGILACLLFNFISVNFVNRDIRYLTGRYLSVVGVTKVTTAPTSIPKPTTTSVQKPTPTTGATATNPPAIPTEPSKIDKENQAIKTALGSNELRSVYWKKSWVKITNSFYSILFGYGKNTIPGETQRTYPHNFILEILLAVGVLGLLAYLCYIGFLFIKLLIVTFKSNKLLFIAILSTITSVYAISMLHPFLTTGAEFNDIFWLIIVGCFVLCPHKEISEKVKKKRFGFTE